MGERKITVVGSFVVDLMSRTRCMPKPGETVIGEWFKLGPGGKGANQAVAAARLGADVSLVTKLGQDFFGEFALKHFADEGICTTYVYTDPDSYTGAALIMVDDQTGQNSIIVNLGANQLLSTDEIEKARNTIISSDMLLGCLEVNVPAVEEAIRIAHNAGVKVILNPAPYQRISKEVFPMIDFLTPNETELAQLAGISVTDFNDAVNAAKRLLQWGVRAVIVTLGHNGALFVTEEKSVHCPPVKVKALDTTGAGDAFNGALAWALARGEEPLRAVNLANQVAGISVTRIGTAPSMPYKHELEKYWGTSEKNLEIAL